MTSGELESQRPHDHQNGDFDPEKGGHSPSQTDTVLPRWKTSIKDFSLIWFSIPMNTGIIAILMHQLPYQFNGLPVLSTIMYVFELVQFVLFSLAFLARIIMFPRETRKALSSSVDDLSYLGMPPVAFLTLTALTGLIVSNAYWGGHAWSLVAYVMWWFGTGWVVVTAFGVAITWCRVRMVNETSLSPGMVMPIVGLATDAVVGATICTYSYHISPRLAVPVIIVSYLCAGLALWFTIILYAFYLQRLFISGFGPHAKRPQLLMLVGPFGQLAGSQVMLASAVQTTGDFAGYARGTFLTAQAASSVSAASIVISLLLVGHDIFWLVIALAGVVDSVVQGEARYTMAWWATVFPVATLTLAFNGLSIALDSPTFRVLNTALLIILLIDYFTNWAFTIWHSVRGTLLVKPPETISTSTSEERSSLSRKQE